ncbi:thiol reductant ABC exporter subunit CydD [Pseudonocardia eucalypti]|uniref:Thiol reductant ABC exporter subunit CydD n=1 Tax=Pseudonocardia eucalypti TaxID=648755 RepID=A0ABP9QJ04_9PSEU|nr:ATP-binding cassette subfamily C protein CydCD [Pseudonocardia eucalypti]
MRPVDPRLLRHAGAARRFILVAAALGVAGAGLVIAQAGLLATVISRAFLDHTPLDALLSVLGLLAAVVVGRAALAWLSETTAHRAAAAVLAQLRATLVAHALRGSPRACGRSPAELATLASTGIDGLEGYFARYLPQLLLAAVVPAAVGARILLADWGAALIVAATVPLIPLFMILIGLYTRRHVRRQWHTLCVLAHHFMDLVAGLAVLTAFGRARGQAATIRRITERYRGQTMRTLRVAFLSALVLELLATLSVAMVAVSVGLRLVSGGLDLHTALLVLILVPEVYLPLRAVGARFHDSAQGLAAAEDVFAVLDAAEPPQGRRRPAPDPAKLPVRLDDVRVDGRSSAILDRLTLEISPGQVVGVVGPSGCGKSTLVDLLLAFRTPDAGRVTVGGVDLTEIDRDAWLARIAWVPQQPRLVRGTIEQNLRLGRPEATHARVRAAATAAGLDIPLDRVVGELGAGLSTGQQRRVALARALLADRPLLLLDEPTEGVDADTEAAILAALPAALAGRTAVIATHRPAVLALCDTVLTLPGATPVAANQPSESGQAVPEDSGAAAPTAAGVIRPEDQYIGTGGARRWLARLVRPYRTRLALATLAGAGALASGVALTATSAWLISTAALHPPVLSLMVAIVAVRTFGLSKAALRYLERLISHDIALRLLGDLRVRVWQALVRLGPAATARLRRGDLLHRLIADVDAQQDLLVRGLVPVAAAAVVGAGTAIGLGLLLPAAGVALLVGLAVAGIAAPGLSALAGRAAERRTSALRADVVSGTVELLTAAPDLIALGAVAPRQRAVAARDTALTRALRTAALTRGAGIGLATLAVGATAVACAALGVAALGDGLAGPLLAVLALTPLATAELVTGLPEAAQRLLGAGHAVRRLAELDQMPATCTEPGRPAPVPPTRSLRATHLAVRWPDSPTDAVQNVTLAVSPDRRLALTGPSGSGKSTVLAALMRTLDPSAGTIHADDLDTRRCTGDDLRSRIAWCGPDTHLFDSTLRENLRLAAPDADDTHLIAGLRRVRLGDWFDALPDGLDTRLGTHGTPVSGGERQRLGLARALLADRPILLLDEPTAHLDTPTATALAQDLLAYTTGRAALIVTHQPRQFGGLPTVALTGPMGAHRTPDGTRSTRSARRPVIATSTKEATHERAGSRHPV